MRPGARGGGLLLAVACCTAGGSLLARVAYLEVKGRLAGVLVEQAFRAHLRDGRPHRPWRWADTHPIASLEVPRLGVRRVVLDGATGAVLAFGPGRIHGTGLPNGPGNCVIAGHRDSWFAFLEELRVGDELVVETRAGARRWAVESLQVTSMRDPRPLEPTGPRLTLITCWPFHDLRGGDRRYVVYLCPHADPGADRTGPHPAGLHPPRQGVRARSRRDDRAVGLRHPRPQRPRRPGAPAGGDQSVALRR